jgi:hypothetical protein
MKFRVVLRDEAGRPDIRDIVADSPEEAEAVMALEGLTVSEIHPLGDSAAPAPARPRPDFGMPALEEPDPIRTIALPPAPPPAPEGGLSGRQVIGLILLSLALIATGAYLISQSRTLGRSSGEIFAFGMVALVGGLLIPVGWVFLVVLFWFLDSPAAAQPVVAAPAPVPAPVPPPDRIATEYAWDESIAKASRNLAVVMAIILAIGTAAMILLVPMEVPRWVLLLPGLIFGSLLVLAFRVFTRRISYRGCVVHLTEDDVTYSPYGQSATTIPWDQVLRAESQGGQLTLHYLTYDGKAAKLPMPISFLRNGMDIFTFVGRRLGAEWKKTGLFLK